MDAVKQKLNGVLHRGTNEGSQQEEASSSDQIEARALPDRSKSTTNTAKSDKKAMAPSPNKTGQADAPLPDFILERNRIFDELKQKRNAEILEKEKPTINVVLSLGLDKDGKPRPDMPVAAKAWESTPGSFLRHVDKDISADVVVAKINGTELWDLDRPLEYSCRLAYIPFSSAEGRNVFWHSSAHVLGECAECQYHCLLSHGPPVEQGFFYDMALPEGHGVKEADWPSLESRANKFCKEKQQFERLHVSIPDLKRMFGYSKYKMYYIDNKLPKDGSTVYRNGTLVDLCTGPHIQNSGKIKAYQIMKNSSCYFLGDKTNDSLQRIYGVAFPDKKLMTEHKRFLEEAKERDHRKIGTDQELFFFDELSPGSAFLLPHGTIIFNALQKLLRAEYRKRGYQEVQSPNMYDADLWKRSGHWKHYADDMFSLDVEKRKWALKPMNCPGHCIMFGHRERSYRELPLRMADFGVLHRNEASGALNGLTRVRKFQQDDTHIFCTQDQITQEIEGLFDFLKCIYGLFGFPFKLKLSTRPEKFLGNIETWDVAEQRLKEALDTFTAAGNGQWELNEGDGAFYGPKIDIEISDALKRDFQCATIQLDFQLPQNFELEYMTADAAGKGKATNAKSDQPNNPIPSPLPILEDKRPDPNPTSTLPSPDTTGKSTATTSLTTAEPVPMPSSETAAVNKARQPGPGRARPVMIHRAIIGSFERFMAILTEHFGGKWPFWLSPRQILVIPVTPAVNEYVEQVQAELKSHKLLADIDVSGNTMPKKIRTGQLQQYNFIFVVGVQERDTRSVNIRNRDDKETQSKGELIALDEAVAKLKALKKERRLVNSI